MLFLVMVFEYVVVLPASIAFSNIQSYKHENPLKADVSKVLDKLDNMDRRMDKLDDMEKMLISSGEEFNVVISSPPSCCDKS